MKTIYIVILLALIGTIANAQCNTAMAGAFIQKDSCSGYLHYESSNVIIVSSTGTDIIIQEFSDFFPYYNANVTLDCINHTAIIPNQYAGQVALWGSGTFSSDYNSMTLNYHLDFGTSTSTCVAKYTRQGSGILDETHEQNQLSILPNPFSTHATLQSGKFFKDATLTVYNSFGQTVKQIKNISGQTIILQRDNLPIGLYFLQLTQDNKTFITEKLIITDN